MNGDEMVRHQYDLYLKGITQRLTLSTPVVFKLRTLSPCSIICCAIFVSSSEVTAAFAGFWSTSEDEASVLSPRFGAFEVA